MISMTGFACREQAIDGISVSVEIRGYNNRFLEIYVNTPPWLSRLEPEIRALVGEYCGRGKVEVSLRVKEQNPPLSVTVNTSAASAYMDAFSGLAAALGIEEKVSLSVLISLEGVIDVDKKRDNGRYWILVEPVLREAVLAFREERLREGKHTEEDILNSVSIIEKAMNKITANVSFLENSIKENIMAKFRELCADTSVVIDENRILAETAMLLVKYTISEELSRLSSHLGEFRETAKSERPGKKLDFLCQEINREINTIGSKSAVLEVSRAVVEMKESLENIREQLRNIE